MFESRLAPAPGAAVHRDLSSFEIWEISLARSRRRRELAERHRKAAPKTKGAAAAMSAALLVSPVLPIASAGAQSDGPGPASAPPRTPTPGVDGAIVKRGDVGVTVAEVQRKVGVDDDGIFGPITEGAVGDFQTRSGLRRTGIVDVATWKALFRASVSFVQPDSAVAKRIVAQLPRGPEAPRRRGGTGGGQATAAAQAPAAAPAPAASPASEPAPAAERAPAAAGAATSAEPAPAPAGSDACDGKIITPVRGSITSGFGAGRHHQGIDIAAPVGTAVRAAACGTVSLAGSQSGYGNIVCIQHSSSFSTCYAHLSEMNVQQGAYVSVGQVIGKVGMTGRTTGPHLHFETRVGGQPQDPAPYLSWAKSMPEQPQGRTARAVTASRAVTPPQAKASTRAVVSRSGAGSYAPAQQDTAAVAASQAQAQAAPPAAAEAPTHAPRVAAPGAPAAPVGQPAPEPAQAQPAAAVTAQEASAASAAPTAPASVAAAPAAEATATGADSAAMPEPAPTPAPVAAPAAPDPAPEAEAVTAVVPEPALQAETAPAVAAPAAPEPAPQSEVAPTAATPAAPEPAPETETAPAVAAPAA